jgi:preprotein translocase subunit YajC
MTLETAGLILFGFSAMLFVISRWQKKKMAERRR